MTTVLTTPDIKRLEGHAMNAIELMHAFNGHPRWQELATELLSDTAGYLIFRSMVTDMAFQLTSLEDNFELDGLDKERFPYPWASVCRTYAGAVLEHLLTHQAEPDLKHMLIVVVTPTDTSH